MDPVLFGRDIERTPETLRALAVSLRAGNPFEPLLARRPVGRRLVLLGMGSSHFANSVLALRLQAAGIDAYAALASADPLPAGSADDVVVAVSASGGSAETLDAIRHYTGKCTTIALTNTAGSLIEAACDVHVSMAAGVEDGGVACRSFAHTLGLHLAIRQALTGVGDAASTIEAAAEASADLLARRGEWIDPMIELLVGPDGTAFVAPGRRLSSAQQSALMMREGPRLPAIACETGDWSHIDVYLTKTTDYRMLLFTGSPWEAQLLDWCHKRGTTVVALGADVPGARLSMRYLHDDVDDVRLLTEPIVAECIAQSIWFEGAQQ